MFPSILQWLSPLAINSFHRSLFKENCEITLQLLCSILFHLWNCGLELYGLILVMTSYIYTHITLALWMMGGTLSCNPSESVYAAQWRECTVNIYANKNSQHKPAWSPDSKQFSFICLLWHQVSTSVPYLFILGLIWTYPFMFCSFMAQYCSSHLISSLHQLSSCGLLIHSSSSNPIRQ